MPLMWMMSIFVMFLIILVLIMMFFYKSNDCFCFKNVDSNYKHSMIIYLW